ncbi:MAG: NAD(+)/NADH kinase [Sutterella sp.]|nr:NAD(+)/NADH kinase [Sutterella sp.]
MPKSFQNIAVLVKPTETDPRPLQACLAVLERCGRTVFLCENSVRLLGSPSHIRGYSRQELARRVDMAVVLGGDGTLLGVGRHMFGYDVPIVGVNAGRLGFITDIVLDEMEEVLPQVLEGQYTLDERHLLEADIVRDGKVVFSGVAVNDIGVTHGRVGGMVEFVIYVNGQQMSSQLADGIICSSATGSTAYSLAAGGPIMHPALNGLCLVPVAPHTLSSRPIVLPSDVTIDIEVIKVRDAVAYYDMQEFFDVQAGDRLSIRNSAHKLVLLHPKTFDYYELLRQKLKWNFMPIGESASGQKAC